MECAMSYIHLLKTPQACKYFSSHYQTFAVQVTLCKSDPICQILVPIPSRPKGIPCMVIGEFTIRKY